MDTARHPQRVSVVIPCRNEARHIRECVESALNSNYPDVEVIVVDGMSEDGTRQVLADLAREHSNFKFIDNVAKLTPFAFNLGIKAASGEFIQIVGSRNVLAPDYIAILVKRLAEHPEVACVGGDYQHVYENSESQVISWAMESKFGMGASNYRTQDRDTYVDTVGVPMFRRSVFDQVGWFDERLTRNQDDDFSYRLVQAGHKILYVHQAKTTYLVRASLKKAFSQFFQYGYFKVFVNKKHRAVTTARQLVPFAFVGFWPLAMLLTLLWPPVAAVMVVIALLYAWLGLRAAAGFTTSWSERLSMLKVFWVLHTAYGLGYWRGIWDFLICQRLPAKSLQGQTT